MFPVNIYCTYCLNVPLTCSFGVACEYVCVDGFSGTSIIWPFVSEPGKLKLTNFVEFRFPFCFFATGLISKKKIQGLLGGAWTEK